MSSFGIHNGRKFTLYWNGAESIGKTVGRRAIGKASARMSVAQNRSETNRCLKSARIPGQPMNPLVPVLGKTNTKVIANISQLTQNLGTINTSINQSSLEDETQLIINTAQSLGTQNSVNSSNCLQTCADLCNGMQIESYRRLVSKPERPPRAIDSINTAQSLGLNKLK